MYVKHYCSACHCFPACSSLLVLPQLHIDQSYCLLSNPDWSRLIRPIQTHISSHFKKIETQSHSIKSGNQSVILYPHKCFLPPQSPVPVSSAALRAVLWTAARCLSWADETREGSGQPFDLSLVFILHLTSPPRHSSMIQDTEMHH